MLGYYFNPKTFVKVASRLNIWSIFVNVLNVLVTCSFKYMFIRSSL